MSGARLTTSNNSRFSRRQFPRACVKTSLTTRGPMTPPCSDAPADAHPDGPNPRAGALLTGPATRREVFLFGLLILALVWVTVGQRPRTVVVVPDSAVRVGVIT